MKRARSTAPSLEGAIGIDPNIKAPYTHEASVWVERQLTDTMGMRAGFVYKTEDDLIGDRRPGPRARTAPTPCRSPFIDIGVDGVRGTADDQVHHDLRHADEPGGELPADQVVENVPR